MLLRVGPVDVCTVGKNNIRQMMIKYIGKTYSASMELGSDPAETYEIFRKLNQSYMQHIRKMRLNVSRSVEKLLLEASNSTKDPMHDWVLVSFRVFLIQMHKVIVSVFRRDSGSDQTTLRDIPRVSKAG